MGRLLSKFWKLSTYLKILITLGVVTLLIIVISYAICTYYEWKARKVLAVELQKMRDRGEPVTLEELAPPPVPDNENAATFYLKAFDTLENLTEDEEHLIKNIDFKKEFDEETIEKTRGLVKKYKNVLLFSIKATHHKKCQFPFDYSVCIGIKSDPYSDYITGVSGVRTLIGISAVISAIDNKPEEVLDRWDVLSYLSESLNQDKLLTPYYVSIITTETGIDTLERILELLELPPEKYIELAKTIEPEKTRGDLNQALIEERCGGIVFFDLTVSGKYPKSFRMARMASLLLPDFIILRDEAFYIRFMTELIEKMKMPYFERKGAMQGLVAKIIKMKSPWHALSSVMLPSIIGCGYDQAKIEAKLGTAKIALFLKYYKVKKDRYPKLLAELEDFLKEKLPTDPFTGKNYHYLQKEKGFIVYSVGSNEEDDGGIEEGEEDEDDITFKCAK